MKIFSKNQQTKQKQGGFTILEVLIATTIFSFALGLISVGFMEITRMYRQGITTRTVQQNSRFIVDDIVRSSRTANSVIASGNASGGQISITYPEGRLNPEGTGTVQQTLYCFNVSGGTITKHDNAPTGITCSSGSLPAGTSMLENRVKLVYFGTPVSVGARSVSLDFKIGIGETDILISDECIVGKGRQFCAVDSVYTTVTARGGSDG